MCLVRYLLPSDHHTVRITKTDKYCVRKLDLKYIKFAVKIQDKIENKNSIAVSVLVMKIRKNIQSTYQGNVVKKYNDSIFTGEEGRKHYVLMKEFNTFMYDHILHRGKKTFLSLLVTSFQYGRDKLKHYIKDCFNINGQQRIKMPNKNEYVKFKNVDNKRKSPFRIYAGLHQYQKIIESNILKPPSYANKYPKQVAYSCGYKLVCVDDQFSKPFKS